MPQYQTRGQVPHKRHTVFRQPNGKLFAEELISSEGFSNDYTNAYHVHPPTRVLRIGEARDLAPIVVMHNNMQHRSLRGFQAAPQDDYLEARSILLTNSDLQIAVAAPRKGMDYFYKNASADELVFIHEGSGTLHTAFGQIKFGYGDYLIIPRGVVHQFEFDTDSNRHFIVESFTPIVFPKKYLSRYGQLMEHAPFCERDIRTPQDLVTHPEEGEFLIKIKKQHQLYPYTYANHPFDFVGWDGCFYPYAFSIHDFEPITGRIHQPPPVHQNFEAHNFVICSFVPRLFDYHPESIPAPYHHSNIDSDELLYYVDGNFMSRKNVERGQMTLHPMGIPHGPHPGTVEKSIGAKETIELAVMVDTFRPLALTQAAFDIEDPSYFLSWMDA
jgi:homogentisate 1,2-dioxygenase